MRFAKGDELADSERNRLTLALVAGVRGLENVYLQQKDHGVDAFSAYGWRGSVMYESAPFAAWWTANRSRFNDSFADAFEADRPQLR